MGSVKEVNEVDFQKEVLDSDQPVLVDFWAPWCGPCRMIGPMVEQLAINYEGRARVVKVDIDQNPSLAMKFHVRSIPMLLVFKGGQVHGSQVGAAPMSSLAALLDGACAK